MTIYAITIQRGAARAASAAHAYYYASQATAGYYVAAGASQHRERCTRHTSGRYGVRVCHKREHPALNHIAFADITLICRRDAMMLLSAAEPGREAMACRLHVRLISLMPNYAINPRFSPYCR